MTTRDYGDAVNSLCCGSSACPRGNLGVGHLEQSPRGSPRWPEKRRPIRTRGASIAPCPDLLSRARRRRTLDLIRQSRPLVVTPRKKGIGPRRDPPYRFAHEVRQWPRRSEGNPWSTRGSPSRSDRWGYRGCTRRHAASDRVQLGEVGRRRHRSGREVIEDRQKRRSTSFWTQQTSRPSGNLLPGTGVATAGVPHWSTRNCSGSRRHHVGSSSCRCDLFLSSVRRRSSPGNRPTAQPSPNGRRGSRQSPGGNLSPKHSWFYQTAPGTASPRSRNPSLTRMPAAEVAAPNAPNR